MGACLTGASPRLGISLKFWYSQGVTSLEGMGVRGRAGSGEAVRSRLNEFVDPFRALPAEPVRGLELDSRLDDLSVVGKERSCCSNSSPNIPWRRLWNRPPWERDPWLPTVVALATEGRRRLSPSSSSSSGRRLFDREKGSNEDDGGNSGESW